MRAPEGAAVVLVRAGAHSDAIYHLPAPVNRNGNVRFEETTCPDVWPTLCRLEGGVYSMGGAIARRRLCGVCEKRAPRGSLKRERKPGQRRAGKPRGKYRYATEAQLRALHLLHWEQEVPINELGRRYWRKLGHASANACANSLSKHFAELGLPRHDRIAMTVKASTRHGLARRSAPKSGGKFGNGSKAPGYKRWLLNQRAGGETRNPLCAALNRRGIPCRHRALNGSVYCFSHEPARREQVRSHLEAMRSRSSLHNPARLEAAGELRELLLSYHAAGGQWRQLSRATRLPEHWLSHVARGMQKNVDRGRAQLVRDVITPVEMAA